MTKPPFIPPIPENELDRLLNLADHDLDFSNIEDHFKDLTRLAAMVAGTRVSLVNLIDAYNQWTVANYGHDNGMGLREDSVCQLTIMGDEPFEIKDLRLDERFKDKDYVLDDPHFHYYFGIPLTSREGFNLGALCVLDSNTKEISPEKLELLKIIAGEVCNRLVTLKVIQRLRQKVKDADDTQRRVAHDIRGPLGGIINLAEMVSQMGDENKLEEVIEFMTLIHKSGKSILELADTILSANMQMMNAVKTNEFTLLSFKDRLDKLYVLQAQNKGIQLEIHTNTEADTTPFSSNKLLQIIGNLISNALKFTPPSGRVTVNLDLQVSKSGKNLVVIVEDTGIGLSQESIDRILCGTAQSTGGTTGEEGYGFGLALVKHLIEGLKGSFKIESTPNKGSRFEVCLPQ